MIVKPDKDNPLYFNVVECEKCGHKERVMNNIEIGKCKCENKSLLKSVLNKIRRK